MEYPESHLMFESSGFRRMVAPHLPIKPGGKALGLARDEDDEGWEAMAMRDELTDVMLHNAFGDAILKEVGWVDREGCVFLSGQAFVGLTSWLMFGASLLAKP